jgi:hypothetical protein
MIVSSGSASKATSDAPPLVEWQILGIWALTPKREVHPARALRVRLTAPIGA